MKAKIRLPKSGYFTIYEDKWVNGNNEFNLGCSALLNGKGNSCCVGHFLRDCGVPISNLDEKFTIDGRLIEEMKTLVEETKCLELASWKDKCESKVFVEAIKEKLNIYDANDDKFLSKSARDISIALRKKILRELFMKQFGLKIVFRKHSPKIKK